MKTIRRLLPAALLLLVLPSCSALGAAIERHLTEAGKDQAPSSERFLADSRFRVDYSRFRVQTDYQIRRIQRQFGR